MKQEFKMWREYLTEQEVPIQDEYEAFLYLGILQTKSIDRTEIMAFIRAIKNVTTVYREDEISTSAAIFVGEYKIRFVLEHGGNAKEYYEQILKPGIRKIKGLSIHRDEGFEKIGEK